jgi:16S rRNA (guanine527-N7)-methyltransferase
MTAHTAGRQDLQLRLAAGVGALDLNLSDAQQQQLLSYMDLIQKWNKVYNLTALRDPQEMLTHHLLDSLSAIAPLLRHLRGGAFVEGGACSLLDVGSGGGLPGVVIAICCPQIKVTCVDAVSKKAAFVQQVAASLKLLNLKGVHARVETLSGPYDVVCSRAFASLVDFTTWSKSALASHGVWMAMKGKHPDQELALLPESVKVFHVEQLQVPGLDADRCIVWMRG